MVDYLVPFLSLFAADERLKFFITYPPDRNSADPTNSMRKAFGHLPEVGRYAARLRLWDLVVCADHCFGDGRRRSPSVYIGHGAKSKTLPGSETEYTYGPAAVDKHNHPAYRTMLEDNEHYATAAISTNPQLREVIKVVGHPDLDRLPAAAAQRDSYRAQLGFAPNDRVVLFLSTWGPNSLCHIMGDALIEQARQMQSTHRFILSVHSHEYRPKAGARVWGDYFESLASEGFTVRNPHDDWLPYLVASDCVVSDHCGLNEYAVRLHKPLVFTPIPDSRIWKSSLTWAARQTFPIITQGSELPSAITTAMATAHADHVPVLPSSSEVQVGATETNIRREIYELLKLPVP